MAGRGAREERAKWRGHVGDRDAEKGVPDDGGDIYCGYVVEMMYVEGAFRGQ